MKVVINKCFGGFGLSTYAIARYAELAGRKCYFFKTVRDKSGKLNLGEYEPTTVDDDDWVIHAFDIPNPNEVLQPTAKWQELSTPERVAANKKSSEHSISQYDLERNDPLLVRVVEELGAEANGRCAELSVVEIPDDVEWEISEYDGQEHIAEKHATWG